MGMETREANCTQVSVSVITIENQSINEGKDANWSIYTLLNTIHHIKINNEIFDEDILSLEIG